MRVVCTSFARSQRSAWVPWVAQAVLWVGAMVRLQLLLVFLLLAQTTRVAAHRTFADDPDLGTSTPVAWRGPIVLEVPADFSESAMGALQSAVSVWASAECALFELSIETQSDPSASGDGHNHIVFVEDLDDDIGATTDVLLERDADGWFIAEADVFVDASVAWRELGASSGASLRDALVHELGHVLGLLHPCEGGAACEAEHGDSALYPVQRSTGTLTLSADDQAGLCSVYRGAEGCTADCESGPCVAGVCEVACAEVADCDADQECGPLHTCRAASVDRGACDRGEDCATGLCVTTTDASACTNECGGSFECLAGEQCELVGGHRVCVSEPAPAGGCAAAPTHLRAQPTWLALFGWPLLRRPTSRRLRRRSKENKRWSRR